MRILYDSNILVGMLCRREGILAFKKQITQKHIVNVTSGHILSEVEAVLVEKLNLTGQKAKSAVRLLGRQSVIVYPQTIEKVCRDPFDDYIVAAAVLGKVDYIVTEDKDLLVLKNHKGIKIIRLAEFNTIMGR